MKCFAFALSLLAIGAASAQAQTAPEQQQSARANPYAFSWPPGDVYPDYDPLAKSILFAPNNTITVNNQLAYGSLNTASTAAFSINSNRPAGINGYTGDNQIGDIQEIGAMALNAQADAIPYLFEAAGSFTSATFTPHTNLAAQSVIYPFGTVTKATALSLLKVNMWLTTDDPIPYYGRVTKVGDGGAVTVSGWYQLGTAAPGTPAGTKIYANPQNYAWAYLPELFLNPLGQSISGRFTKPTGTVTSGSKTITSVSDTTGVIKGQLLSGEGIPAGAAVTGYTANTITISEAATASHGGTPLNISAFIGNAGAVSEFDLKNDGPAFSPLTPVTVTGCSSVQKSMTLTGCSAIPETVRQGHVVYSTSPAVPSGSSVLSIASSNSVVLNHPATRTATGISLTFYSAFNEGGVGIDMSGITNNASSAYVERGNFSYGYTSLGAGDTSFLVMANGFAALPAYGFRVDKSLIGAPSKAPFALTQNGYDIWKVDGNGISYAPATVYYGAQRGAVAVKPVADSETYSFILPKTAGAPGQVLTSGGGSAPMTWTASGAATPDSAPWTAYTPTLSCGTGRLANASASGRYKTVGKSTFVSLSITIAANGTCANYIAATLPHTANSPAVFAGKDAGRTGVMVQGFADTAQAAMIIQRYDAAYPASDGSGLRVSGIYENR